MMAIAFGQNSYSGTAGTVNKTFTTTFSSYVCAVHCAEWNVAHNIAQNRPDNFPCYPQDNHHSNDVYLREWGDETLY